VLCGEHLLSLDIGHVVSAVGRAAVQHDGEQLVDVAHRVMTVRASVGGHGLDVREGQVLERADARVGRAKEHVQVEERAELQTDKYCLIMLFFLIFEQ